MTEYRPTSKAGYKEQSIKFNAAIFKERAVHLLAIKPHKAPLPQFIYYVVGFLAFVPGWPVKAMLFGAGFFVLGMRCSVICCVLVVAAGCYV